MIPINHPTCRRRAITPNGITADTMKGSTMSAAAITLTATNRTRDTAWRLFTDTFSAMTLRNDDGGKLSVANLNGSTLVLELQPIRGLPNNERRTELDVVLMLANGDVWGLHKWEGLDAGQLLAELCQFLTRHECKAPPAGPRYVAHLQQWNGYCDHPKCETLHASSSRYRWETASAGNRFHVVPRTEWIIVDTSTGERVTREPGEYSQLTDAFETKREAVAVIARATS
jgi:hypothetical protein